MVGQDEHTVSIDHTRREVHMRNDPKFVGVAHNGA